MKEKIADLLLDYIAYGGDIQLLSYDISPSEIAKSDILQKIFSEDIGGHYFFHVFSKVKNILIHAKMGQKHYGQMSLKIRWEKVYRDSKGE